MANEIYDRYDKSKNYKRLLFRAGLGLQSAELNDLQSGFYYELSTIANAIFGDGALLKGGLINKSGNTVNIEYTEIYLKGFTNSIDSTSIELTNSGTEIIGLALLEEVITELQDPTLRDPAVGEVNFDEKGAVRLKQTVRWSLSDATLGGESFYPTFVFEDGLLVTKSQLAPELEASRTMIARYDEASSGSYVVNGLEISFNYDDADNQQHVFSISEGMGHVSGYEVHFQYAQKLVLDYNMNKKAVVAEPVTFVSGTNTYTLRNGPIASINGIIGVKSITESITHANSVDSLDLLPNTPVVSIISVSQGATTYTEGVDYTKSGDHISWALGGNEPAPGSTYEVTYTYTSGTISTSITSPDTITVENLADNTVFYINYEYYLERVDRVILTIDGDFKILKGIPDDINPTPPSIPPIGLSLGTIKTLYGTEPIVNLDYFKAYKMSDIQDLFKRVTDIQYNIARLSLKDDITSKDPSTNKINTVVDPFIDDDLRDLGISQSSFISEEHLMHNTQWINHPLTLSSDLQLPYNHSNVLSQTGWTGQRKINEFANQSAPNSNVTVSPSTYRWVAVVTSRTVFGRNASTSSSTFNLGRTAIVPQIQLTLNSGRYNGNEIVDVYFDNRLIGQLTANIEGFIVNQQITIPANTTSGSKVIKLVGRDSEAEGTTIFTSIPLITERTFTVRPPAGSALWNAWFGGDPLAQTFTLNSDRFISRVSLRFTVLPTDYVDVLITETTVGIPDMGKVLTSKRIFRDEITANNWTDIVFDNPCFTSSGVEYAIVVATNDSITKVNIAELGEFDEFNKKWITKQSYAVGALLTSSNANSWTALQKEDLTFKLDSAVYVDTNTVSLGTVSVVDATDLMIMAEATLYPSTYIEFNGVLLDRNNEVVKLAPNSVSAIKDYTGDIALSVTMSTADPLYTPVLSKDIQLAVGTVQFPATYVMREFDIDGTHLRLNLDMLEPTNSSIKAFYQEADGTTWTELTRNEANSKLLANGYLDMEFKKDNIGLSKTRLKITLDTTDHLKRPSVKNLRAYII